jgi:glycosyltransferase involved in cell wall biosynthesis
MEPLVSVAIPTYNRLRYLKPCLESIKHQTIGAVRLYIFDDGSTEPIEAEARALFGENLIIIRNARNRGASANIEQALQYPYSTPFVMVFHDDDVMHPRLLAEEVALLQRFPEKAFAACAINFCHTEDQMNTFTADAQAPISFTAFSDSVELTRSLLVGSPLGFSSVLYRTSVLNATSALPHERFGANDDRPFLVGLAQGKGALFINNRLLNYRIHAAQDSQRSATYDADNKRAIELFIFYRDQLPQPLSIRDKRLLLRMTTNNLLHMYSMLERPTQSLIDFLKYPRSLGFYDLRYMNYTGIRACVRMFFKKIWKR